MPSVESFFGLLAQVLQPLASTVSSWTILVIALIAFVIRRFCLPCITLKGLEKTLSDLETLFEQYKNKLPIYRDCNAITDPKFWEYKSRLLRAQRKVGALRLADCDAQSPTWSDYLRHSTSIRQRSSRLRDIVTFYKELCALQADIQYAKASQNQKTLELQLQPVHGMRLSEYAQHDAV